MTVIITGAAGFIGSHLSKHLSLETEIICCDPADPAMSSIDECIGYMGDNPDKIDAVYNLGANSSTTETSLINLTDNNIKLSAVLMDVCAEYNIPLVYASSASVYGLGENGFKEDAVMTPLNYYSISKMTIDLYAKQKICDNPTLRLYGLRYFNVYGLGEASKKDQASPVHKFLSQAKTNGEIKIFEGSDNFLRDFIHIDDVVKMTAFATSLSKPGIYNIGTGKSRSFYDIANIVSKLTDAKIAEVPFPRHLKNKYQHFTESDNGKIFSSGYTQDRLSLERGIEQVFHGS